MAPRTRQSRHLVRLNLSSKADTLALYLRYSALGAPRWGPQ
jgi:hypothetical protein